MTDTESIRARLHHIAAVTERRLSRPSADPDTIVWALVREVRALAADDTVWLAGEPAGER